MIVNIKRQTALLCLLCLFVTVLPGQISAAEEEPVLRVGMEVNSAPFNWSQSDDSDGLSRRSTARGHMPTATMSWWPVCWPKASA